MATSDALSETYEHELDEGSVVVWDDVPDGDTPYDVDEQEPYEHEIQVAEPVVWSSDEFIPVTGDGPRYEGPYEAKPLFRTQTFATAMKVMRDDFSVTAINYTEAPNDCGTTLTIGG